jgi:hypothetical protein
VIIEERVAERVCTSVDRPFTFPVLGRMNDGSMLQPQDKYRRFLKLSEAPCILRTFNSLKTEVNLKVSSYGTVKAFRLGQKTDHLTLC